MSRENWLLLIAVTRGLKSFTSVIVAEINVPDDAADSAAELAPNLNDNPEGFAIPNNSPFVTAVASIPKPALSIAEANCLAVIPAPTVLSRC